MAVTTPNLTDAADPDVALDHGGGADTSGRAEVFEPWRKEARVKVGGAYVTGDKASAAQAKQAVATSSAMLQRLGHTIAKPGIQLRTARDIPLFFADPKHPGRFLRKLNGKTEPGVLENGAFKVVD